MADKADKREIPKKKKEIAWIGYFTAVVLLVLVFLGIYYFRYVESQKTAYSETLLRVLTTSGENIGTVIQDRRINIENACSVSVSEKEIEEILIKEEAKKAPDILKGIGKSEASRL